MLDLTKLESGTAVIAVEPMAAAPVVEEVRSLTEVLATAKGLRMDVQVDPTLAIRADRQRVKQILLNLVGNALKFTTTGGVTITAAADVDFVAFVVRDTGRGIPADQLARVFEQFHQVDNSNTKKKGGTGLGLAIAKQIVEMHGGRVWVESEPGKGATFLMQVPVRAESRKFLQ